MRMNLKFLSLFMALIMVMLIFTQPSVILAQQNSVESQAKIAAERDAETDVNKLLWGSAGLSVAAFWGLVGFATFEISRISARGSELIGDEAASSWTNALVAKLLSQPAVYTGIGLGCGLSLLTAIGITLPSTPPPERLIGKSPEYVDFYINAYRAKARRLKGSSTIIGAAAGCGLGLIWILGYAQQI